MREIIWKLIWKIICKWKKVASRNKLHEQVEECDEILKQLYAYRKHMVDKGFWR